MANLDLLEKSIPVAPIKIAALKGCEELGKTVNDYLVQFRKELMEHRTNGIAVVRLRGGILPDQL